MSTDGEYIHGFGANEMQRLTRLQQLLNDAELELLDLSEVHSVLDVGAGLGQMTRAIARRAGPGVRVLGIERDARQREEAARQAAAAGEARLVEMRAGSALALPLEPGERGSFDLAHARFLLEHVTDPQAVVNEMVAAVRPGGRIALLDDDHDLLRLWPDEPTVARAWEVYWRSYERIGCDPLVGRRFAGLLASAGAEVVRLTTIFYGASRGMPHFDLVVDNLAGVLVSAQAQLDSSGRFSTAQMQHALDCLQAWRQRPGASVWYSLPFAEGRRPR
ncbi:MAG TPA: methyltransferase domain-containing protein [Planctomycetota bacterium]|nr:methyltransferase domain-containing protein [Planctomycetota bacterium]